MSDSIDPREPSAPPRRAVPGAVWALVAVGLLWGGWQLIAWGVRAYVDSRIERTVGHVVDFELRDLDGRTWRASELRGRTVVLHFFRSKCPICIAEAPVYRELETRLNADRAVLLGVLLDEVQGFGADLTKATLAKLDYRHPVLVADATFVDAFHGAGWSHVTPITYIVGPDGAVTATLRGYHDVARLSLSLPPGAVW